MRKDADLELLCADAGREKRRMLLFVGRGGGVYNLPGQCATSGGARQCTSWRREFPRKSNKAQLSSPSAARSRGVCENSMSKSLSQRRLRREQTTLAPPRPNLIGMIGCAPEQQASSHMLASNWRIEELVPPRVLQSMPSCHSTSPHLSA